MKYYSRGDDCQMRVDFAPYKEMYLTMARAARDAIEDQEQSKIILTEAMRKCEEMYINAGEENNKDAQ